MMRLALRWRSESLPAPGVLALVRLLPCMGAEMFVHLVLGRAFEITVATLVFLQEAVDTTMALKF